MYVCHDVLEIMLMWSRLTCLEWFLAYRSIKLILLYGPWRCTYVSIYVCKYIYIYNIHLYIHHFLWQFIDSTKFKKNTLNLSYITINPNHDSTVWGSLWPPFHHWLPHPPSGARPPWLPLQLWRCMWEGREDELKWATGTAMAVWQVTWLNPQKLMVVIGIWYHVGLSKLRYLRCLFGALYIWGFPKRHPEDIQSCYILTKIRCEVETHERPLFRFQWRHFLGSQLEHSYIHWEYPRQRPTQSHHEPTHYLQYTCWFYKFSWAVIQS